MEYKVYNTKSAILRTVKGITSTQLSETLPNQTLSMKQLVERHVKGHTIPGLKNYPYDSDQPGETPLPEIGMMSKTAAAQFRMDIKETIKENEAHLIETRKKIAFNRQQMAAAKVAANAKKQTPSQAPQVPNTDEKQL